MSERTSPPNQSQRTLHAQYVKGPEDSGIESEWSKSQGEEESMSFKTEQEAFWAGDFGSQYTARSVSEIILAANINLFTRALSRARGLSTCIEFGANAGMNLKALRLLYPQQEQHALEINPSAAEELGKVIPPDNILGASVLEFTPARTWDLVLVKGLLIHINPHHLNDVYDVLHAATGHYLLVSEYYNPVPVTLEYRGHHERLFKRDFCGEILDRHPDLFLIDYGFIYHRDPSFPMDDISWFLMEARG